MASIMRDLEEEDNEEIVERKNREKDIKSLSELPLIILELSKECPIARSVLSTKSEEICSDINIRIQLPESHHVCHGIVEGWMILSIPLFVGTTRVIFFLNPITSDIVIVPSPLRFPSNSSIPSISNSKIGRMVASSSPKCKDCVLVCLFIGYAHLAYCRVNYDKSWTMIEAKKEGVVTFRDVEFLNGKLYVRTEMSRTCMLVYDLEDCTQNPPKPIVLGEVPSVRASLDSRISEIHYPIKDIVITFLTRGYASDELLLIYLIHNFVYEIGNVGYMNSIMQYASSLEVTKCEVFKLDTRSNEWEKLDDLGDRVIFLGYLKSYVMSRTLLNCSGKLIRKNSVYFAHYYPCSKLRMKGHVGRLCLNDNNVKYFGAKQDVYPYWFLPSVR